MCMLILKLFVSQASYIGSVNFTDRYDKIRLSSQNIYLFNYTVKFILLNIRITLPNLT